MDDQRPKHPGKSAPLAEPRTLYRTVHNNPPVRDDFLSYEQLGTPMPKNTEQVRRWKGISTFGTLDQARRIARANRAQGGFVAELAIPADKRITYERTGKDAGHYTLWGDPDVIVGLVLSVVPVIEEEKASHGDNVPTLG